MSDVSADPTVPYRTVPDRTRPDAARPTSADALPSASLPYAALLFLARSGAWSHSSSSTSSARINLSCCLRRCECVSAQSARCVGSVGNLHSSRWVSFNSCKILDERVMTSSIEPVIYFVVGISWENCIFICKTYGKIKKDFI